MLVKSFCKKKNKKFKIGLITSITLLLKKYWPSDYDFAVNIIINKTHDIHDLNYATSTYDL